jgi:iron complex outermembrane receptor protein
VDGKFEVGEREMFWDLTAIWSENNAKQTKLNQFNARYVNIALGPADVCAATPGCVPLNIVGEGSMTQEMLDFVTYTGVDTSDQTLFDFTANLAGENSIAGRRAGICGRLRVPRRRGLVHARPGCRSR